MATDGIISANGLTYRRCPDVQIITLTNHRRLPQLLAQPPLGLASKDSGAPHLCGIDWDTVGQCPSRFLASLERHGDVHFAAIDLSIILTDSIVEVFACHLGTVGRRDGGANIDAAPHDVVILILVKGLEVP